MNATLKTLKNTSSFTPVTLELNFQNQKELDLFYAVFNVNSLARKIEFENGTDFTETIRDALRPATSDGQNVMHKRLCPLFRSLDLQWA